MVDWNVRCECYERCPLTLFPAVSAALFVLLHSINLNVFTKHEGRKMKDAHIMFVSCIGGGGCRGWRKKIFLGIFVEMRQTWAEFCEVHPRRRDIKVVSGSIWMHMTMQYPVTTKKRSSDFRSRKVHSQRKSWLRLWYYEEPYILSTWCWSVYERS